MNNPLVVGYKGEIGSFILNGLLRELPKATNIHCVDINDTDEDIIDRIQLADYIFLCVPIDQTVEWIKKYEPILHHATIIEQCSLKRDIIEAVSGYGLNIISMHLLFRPSQTPKEDRIVGYVSIIGLERYRLVYDVLNTIIQPSKTVFYETVDEHDDEMSLQQAVIHRTILVLGEMLSNCKGETFMSRKITELSDRIKQGDVGLYSRIQDNPSLPDMLKCTVERLFAFDVVDYF